MQVVFCIQTDEVHWTHWCLAHGLLLNLLWRSVDFNGRCPPTLPHHSRTPAAFQVPPELRASSSSQVVSPLAEFSHSGCKITKDDLSMLSRKSAGFHRTSPYQVADLQPGVNNRPIREGYQPQSFRLQSKPPQNLM